MCVVFFTVICKTNGSWPEVLIQMCREKQLNGENWNFESFFWYLPISPINTITIIENVENILEVVCQMWVLIKTVGSWLMIIYTLIHRKYAQAWTPASGLGSLMFLLITVLGNVQHPTSKLWNIFNILDDVPGIYGAQIMLQIWIKIFWPTAISLHMAVSPLCFIRLYSSTQSSHFAQRSCILKLRSSWVLMVLMTVQTSFFSLHSKISYSWDVRQVRILNL